MREACEIGAGMHTLSLPRTPAFARDGAREEGALELAVAGRAAESDAHTFLPTRPREGPGEEGKTS